MFVYPVTRSAHVAAQRAATAHQFSRAIDRLFDESTDRLFGGAKAGSAVRTPALDVRETDTTYVIAFDVPGATRDQLKVTVEGRRLSVETTTPVEGTSDVVEGERVIYRERSVPRYERTVVLPAEVDQTQSQAKVENGVLTLTLVKKVPTGALQINVS
jgi:HSP20 family protein